MLATNISFYSFSALISTWLMRFPSGVASTSSFQLFLHGKKMKFSLYLISLQFSQFSQEFKLQI